MNLHQIILPSNNIPASRRFYLKLGFTLIVDSEQYLRFWCDDGDATFSLYCKNDVAHKNSTKIYFAYTGFDKNIKNYWF